MMHGDIVHVSLLLQKFLTIIIFVYFHCVLKPSDKAIMMNVHVNVTTY